MQTSQNQKQILNILKIQLIELKNNILFQQANAAGNIQDDNELTKIREVARKLFSEFDQKLNMTKNADIKINEISEKFISKDTRGDLSYFLSSDKLEMDSF